MEAQKTTTQKTTTQSQAELWEQADKVFKKLRAGWELSEEEINLLRNEEFRRMLAKRIELFPHEWI